MVTSPYRDDRAGREAQLERLVRKVGRLERALSRRRSARLRIATVVVSVVLLAAIDSVALSALAHVLEHGTTLAVDAALGLLAVLVVGEVAFVTWLARRAA